jgi:MFS family permease
MASVGDYHDKNMPASSDRLTLVFSSLGHTLMHMLAALFFVVVLALEVEWELPYHELIELWTLGALLIGLCALPAGWLADRWSAPGMMVVMLVGMGLACYVCAAAGSPTGLLVGLSALGVFASVRSPG